MGTEIPARAESTGRMDTDAALADIGSAVAMVRAAVAYAQAAITAFLLLLYFIGTSNYSYGVPCFQVLYDIIS